MAQLWLAKRDKGCATRFDAVTLALGTLSDSKPALRLNFEGLVLR